MVAACRRRVICRFVIVTRPSRSRPMSSTASVGKGVNCVIDHSPFHRLDDAAALRSSVWSAINIGPPTSFYVVATLAIGVGLRLRFWRHGRSMQASSHRRVRNADPPISIEAEVLDRELRRGLWLYHRRYLSARPSSIFVPPQPFTEFVEHEKLCGAHPSTVLQPLQLALSGAVGALGGLGLFTAACRRPVILGSVMLIRPSRSRLMS
jgi:hypothetical protein